jgi:hypothetical protein
MGAFYATLSFSCQAKAKPDAFVAALLLLWQLSSNHMIGVAAYICANPVKGVAYVASVLSLNKAATKSSVWRLDVSLRSAQHTICASPVQNYTCR